MDLTREYPRSPREQLDGIMLLPRAVDKARAHLEGKLGDYIYYGCRLNLRLFNALGVTEDEFLDAVRTSPDDGAVLEWIHEYVRPERDTIEKLNEWVEHNEPAPQERQTFCDELESVDPGNGYVRTWTELIDLEEGRLKKRARPRRSCKEKRPRERPFRSCGMLLILRRASPRWSMLCRSRPRSAFRHRRHRR